MSFTNKYLASIKGVDRDGAQVKVRYAVFAKTEDEAYYLMNRHVFEDDSVIWWERPYAIELSLLAKLVVPTVVHLGTTHQTY